MNDDGNERRKRTRDEADRQRVAHVPSTLAERQQYLEETTRVAAPRNAMIAADNSL